MSTSADSANIPEEGPAGRSEIVLHVQLAALAVLITCGSLALTGFKFGTNLNVFHIPYVLRFIDRPEFAGDPFVLSLQNFTTAVWPIIRALTDLFDARLVFLTAHVLVRFASVYTLILLTRSAGLGLWGATISAALVSISMALMDASPVGRHEMFITYFTHSVVTWPFIFLFFRSLLHSGFRSASLALALIFDINAFVGFWMLAVAVFQRGREFWMSSARIRIQSIAIFAVAVAPVAIWILSSVTHTGAVTAFSYKQYIREYFPYHFLVEAASKAGLTRVGLYFVAAWFASQLVGHTRFWRRGLMCLLLIFLVGCAAPYVLDTRLIFNFHLLRSEGVLAATSLIVQSMALVAIMSSSTKTPYKFLVVQIVGVAFILPHSLFFAVASTLVFILYAPTAGSYMNRWRQRLPAEGSRPVAIGSIAMIMVATLITWTAAYRGSVSLFKAESELSSGWGAMASAIKRDGGTGPYLVPLGDEADIFVAQAERKIWVSWKEGAVVMWYPSFYEQWSSRWKKLKSLDTSDQYLKYANANRIPEVILKSSTPDCGDQYKLKLQTAGYVWCSQPN